MIRSRLVSVVLAIAAAAILVAVVVIGVAPRRPGDSRLARRPASALPDATAAALSAFEARLLAVRQDRGAPPDVRRNPFAFGEPSRASTGGSSARRVPVSTTRPTDLSPVPPAPLVSLAGIAADEREGGGVVWTAVLSLPDGVELARAGDRVAGRFEVLRVAADGVRVRDRVAGTEFTLTFR